MQNNYLIEYNDTYSLQEKIKEIIKNKKYDDNFISKYDLEEDVLNNLLEELNTYSFLSSKSIIIVSNIQNLNIDNKDTKLLFKYLDNPMDDKLLIMNSDRLDSRKKITKELKKKCEYIRLNKTSEDILISEFNNYKLEDGVIKKILLYTNSNIDAIKCECDKLKLYKDKDNYITLKDVEDVCYRKLGDSTSISFDLTREICSKNKKNAIKLYQKLHEFNIDDMSIMGLLESQLRLLEQVYYSSGSNDYIAKTLDVHPFRVQKTRELFNYITKKDVDNLILSLSDIDLKVKSGIIDVNKPLMMFILNL